MHKKAACVKLLRCDIQYVVISLYKIRDHDWSYTRHVICTNNHCWPCSSAAVNSTSQHYRSPLPVNITSRTEDVIPMHLWLIFGPNAILGTSIIYSALRNVDFVSCDITVV